MTARAMAAASLITIYHRKGRKSIEETKAKKKTRTSAKAVKKWQSTHVKRYGFPVMIDTEPEVIEKLESVPNKSGYIKGLIKADIAKEKESK